MYHHVRKLKGSTVDRLHQYCCVKYPSYGAWHEHPYHSHTHWFIFFIFSIGWLMGIFFQLHLFPVRFAGAASYSWNQSSWVGGVTTNNPNHTSNQTGWTQYSAVDATIATSTTLTLAQQSTTFTENFTETAYKDSSNTTTQWNTYIEFIRLTETDKWASKAVFPSSFSGGVLIPSGGSSYVYGLKGTAFWRYDISGDVWNDPLDPADPTSISSSLGASSAIYVDRNAPAIYVLGGSANFYKYTISTDTWSTLASNSNVASVGALGYPGSGDCIYALSGTSSSGKLDAYSIDNNTWNTNCADPTNPPAGIGTGVSMTWANVAGFTNSLFAFRGGFNSDDFWMYSITNDNWTTPDPVDPPKNVASGGSLTWANVAGVTDYIFADPGDSDRDVWAYSLSNNNWTTMYPQWVIESSATASVMNNNGWSGGAGFTYPGAGNYLYTAHGGNSTAFLRFELPLNYQTPKVVQSIAVDSTTQAIASATLTATSTTPAGTAIAYSMSRNGGTTWETVTSGNELTFADSSEKSDLRWKASLSTTDVTKSPTITNVSITYKYYPASTTLTSSTFNSEASTTQVTQMAWSETVPSGTNVRFQIRTAPDNGSGAPGTWSDWLGPTSTTDYYETTPLGESVNSANSSDANDQWIQYKAYLTSDGISTPTLSGATLSYNILPATPSLSSSTHPSQTTFYPSATPTITITASTPTPDHYHYLVSETAGSSTSIFNNHAGTVAPSTSFPITIASEGTWYVYVIASDSGGTNSANLATYTIKYDPNAPVVPTLSFGSITTSSITVSATSSDSGAGLHATPYYFERDSGAATSGWTSGSWTDSSLSPNKQYSYRVKARDATATPNESLFTAVSQKYTAANTPGTPTISSATATTITLTLNANSNPDITQFSIQESSGQYVQAGKTLNTTETWQTLAQWGTITVTSLSEDTQYSFRVRARNGDTTVTSFSSSASGSTGAGAPQNFRATTIQSSSVTITADDPSYTATAYYFSRTGANSGWTTNYWIDSGLSPNASYTYSVKTRNASNVESTSASLTVITAAEVPSLSSIDTTKIKDTSLVVALGSSSNPAGTEYAIREKGVNTSTNAYVQSSGGALSALEVWQTYTNWGGATGVTVTGLTAGTSYTFVVKARNSEGTVTTESTSVSGTTLAIPGAPSVTTSATTKNQIVFSLTSTNNSLSTQYAIRAVTGDTTSYVQTGGTLDIDAAWQTAPQWGTVTVTGLTANTAYTFSVKGRSSAGFETTFGSGTMESTLATGTPRAPSVTAQSTSSVLVTIDNTDIDPSFSYSIREITATGQYVQTNAQLGGDPARQDYAGWGGASGVSVLALLPRTSYSFRVGAYNPATGLTSFGPVSAAVTTPGGGTADYTGPTVPTNIHVDTVPTVVRNGSSVLGGIRVTWTDPTDADFSAVYIYRAPTTTVVSTTSPIRVEEGSGVFFDQLGLVSERYYNYLLRFDDDNGNRSYSDTFTAQAPSSTIEVEVPLTPLPLVPVPQAPLIAPPPTTALSIPIPTGPRALPSVNIRDLIRVQHPVTTQSIIDSFVSSLSQQKWIRTQLVITDTSLRIAGVFGGLYDVLPKGSTAGDNLDPAVGITIRYKLGDAGGFLKGGKFLRLGYFNANAVKKEWVIIADAEQNISDKVYGSWTAKVSRAGTYGMLILEKNNNAVQ
ncbi:MAG: fibronectin type III domain-containing protein [bacterium]|nr:fibronectin type III domain-containing protein [bacterium]